MKYTKFKFINGFSDIFKNKQKGGVCNTSPHIQHVDKCWCDAITTLVVYADGFKERIQYLFERFNAEQDKLGVIHAYVQGLVENKATYHLPLNYKHINVIGEDREHFIINSVLLLHHMMNRFIRDTELEPARRAHYEQGVGYLEAMAPEQYQIARFMSGDVGLGVANNIAEQIHNLLFYKIKRRDDTSIFYSLYPNIIKIFNYLIMDDINMGLEITHICLDKIDENPINPALLVGAIGCLLCTSEHATSVFNCDGLGKFFDNNNYPTIKNFNWYNLLTTVPTERLGLLEINAYDSLLCNVNEIPEAQLEVSELDEITHIFIFKHRLFENDNSEFLKNYLYYYIDQIMYNLPHQFIDLLSRDLLTFDYIKKLDDNNEYHKLFQLTHRYRNNDEHIHLTNVYNRVKELNIDNQTRIVDNNVRQNILTFVQGEMEKNRIRTELEARYTQNYDTYNQYIDEEEPDVGSEQDSLDMDHDSDLE